MKRLYVGCRVRVVGADAYSRQQGVQVGDTGTVAVLHHVGQIHRVKIDGRPGVVGDTYALADDELEPIQDPGHQVISWADMEGLWQPQGVEA